MNEREADGKVKMQRAEIVKTDEFKYLWSTSQSNGQFKREVKKTLQVLWSEHQGVGRS